MAASCLALAISARAQQHASGPAPDGAASGWDAPTHISITTRSPEIPEPETLTLDFSAGGDRIITRSYPNDAERQQAQVLVVAEHWMATKNAQTQPGHAIDALDGPMLTVQLIERFLGRAYPAGPAALTGRASVDVEEKYKPIRVNTLTAEGGWDAPWMIRGVLERKGATRINFDLVVFHATGDSPRLHSIEFAGTWESAPSTDRLPDSMSLRGWKVYSLGPSKTAPAANAFVESGAEELPVSYATLGDLRGIVHPKTAVEPLRKSGIPDSLKTSLQKY